jgi:predicted DsbA family dithiol-disulfide isomerase
MTDNSSAIVIDYYTDLLCVWAWIAQPRLEEVHRQWGSQVLIRHRYVDIFGDSHGKIAKRWGTDGFEKFAEHVARSAGSVGNTPVHSGLWRKVRPRSSLPAHLLLKATSIVGDERQLEALALKFRRAFFVEGQDISQMSLLLELAASENIDRPALQQTLADGSAMAALSSDQRNAGELGVKGSPTWVLDDGRQLLYGNVGYRILHANIEELAKHPVTEASWC